MSLPPLRLTVPHRRGILGQADPASGADTDLYTVPEGYTFDGTLRATNRGLATTFRVALRPAGAALANEHYIAYDVALAANVRELFEHIEMDETDVVTVRAGTTDLSFTLMGVEEPKA